MIVKDKKLENLLKDKYKDEQVFVIPFMMASNINTGFTESSKENNSIWSKYDNHGKYIMRYDAEYNPAFQQLIPYILIQHPQTGKYFVGKRIQGETRLINKYSLGFGGHINPCDSSKDIILKALFRELYEELDIEPLSRANFIGYVRDLVSETSDHLGFVFVISASKVKIKEDENFIGQWMDLEELEEKYYQFESWAKHIINFLIEHKQ